MSPILSMFYGIIVRMNYEKNEKHNTPHIHAEYQGYEISIDFEGEVIAGSFPKKQLKLLQAWIVIHEDDLKANWKTYHEEGEYFKIKPLEG